MNVATETASADGAKPDPAFLAGAAALDRAANDLNLHTPGADPAAPPAGPVAIDWPSEARELIDFAKELCFPIWPRLAGVWDQEKLERLELRLSRVMQKWDLTGERLGKWAPEIMLAIVVLPATLPTIKAIAADNAEAKAKAIAEARAQRGAPPAANPPPPPPPPASAPGVTAAPPPDTTGLHKQA